MSTDDARRALGPTMISAAALSSPVEIPGVVVVDDDVVPADVIGALRAAIGGSRLIGESQLGGGFSTTRGFGIACHAAAIDDAVARAPFLRPFADLALAPALHARLLRPNRIERLATALLGSINAVYLNVLVVPPGRDVAPHVDATLGVATAVAGDDAPLPPRAVCVLYVDVPPDLRGGELRLYRGEVEAAEVVVAPRAGRLVLFRGTLGHEVTSTMTAGARVSCVAELYALPVRRLRRLPRVRVQSHGFAAVLERLRGSSRSRPT